MVHIRYQGFDGSEGKMSSSGNDLQVKIKTIRNKNKLSEQNAILASKNAICRTYRAIIGALNNGSGATAGTIGGGIEYHVESSDRFVQVSVVK